MKGFYRWFLEGSSHYLTLFLQSFLKRRKKSKSIFLCGPPRCGTSWSSDVLGFYFNLPRPKHYKFPLYFDCVIHTHRILVPINRTEYVYVTRYGLDAYLSRFLQLRRDILKGIDFVGKSKYLKIFNDLENEKKLSDNVRALIEFDLKAKNSLIYSLAKIEQIKLRYNAVVIDYDEAQKDPLSEFSRVVLALEGAVDTERLGKILDIQSKASQRKMNEKRRSTHINRSASKAKEQLSAELVEYYDTLFAELQSSKK